ncbi:MAG: Cbb3-type cytochrome oxidase component [Rhodocyclales bacterium]|nr:Cbb3-type cytochrome oxidase component [Rhodocyclales bacterium]
MDINTLRSISTVICLAIFMGVVWWAYRRSNAERFHEASMLPFALDEDVVDEPGASQGGQPQ